RAEPGVRPAASSSRGVLTRQRCFLTAECSSQQEWAQEECRSSFLPLRNCTTRRSSTRRSLSSTSPPGPAYRRRTRCSSAASLSPGRKTKPCSSAELDPPLRLLGSRCLWLIQHSNCMTTPPPCSCLTTTGETHSNRKSVLLVWRHRSIPNRLSS